MSRRNSSTRRRSYGRRRHEINERRPLRHRATEWLDQLDQVDPSGSDRAGADSTPGMLARPAFGGGPEGARP